MTISTTGTGCNCYERSVHAGMAPRYGVCSGFAGMIGSVICTDKCGVMYRIRRADDKLKCDPFDFRNNAPFCCNSCSKHRFSVAPGTPERGQNFAASRVSSSSTTVTLDEVMQQLKLTDVVIQQLRHSSGVEDSRLGLILDLLAGIERNMAGIFSDVGDFSASRELLTERVTALAARVDVAD